MYVCFLYTFDVAYCKRGMWNEMEYETTDMKSMDGIGHIYSEWGEINVYRTHTELDIQSSVSSTLYIINPRRVGGLGYSSLSVCLCVCLCVCLSLSLAYLVI